MGLRERSRRLRAKANAAVTDNPWRDAFLEVHGAVQRGLFQPDLCYRTQLRKLQQAGLIVRGGTETCRGCQALLPTLFQTGLCGGCEGAFRAFRAKVSRHLKRVGASSTTESLHSALADAKLRLGEGPVLDWLRLKQPGKKGHYMQYSRNQRGDLHIEWRTKF